MPGSTPASTTPSKLGGEGWPPRSLPPGTVAPAKPALEERPSRRMRFLRQALEANCRLPHNREATPTMKVSGLGQLTIPASIREQLHQEGDPPCPATGAGGDLL